MSEKKAKEKRRQLRLIQGEGKSGDPGPTELSADPRDRILLEKLSETIKRLPDDPNQRTEGARLLIEVVDHPKLAESAYLKGFNERFSALLRDMCNKLGYEGIYISDPQFGQLRPAEAPKGVFTVYKQPKQLIVFGGDEDGGQAD